MHRRQEEEGWPKENRLLSGMSRRPKWQPPFSFVLRIGYSSPMSNLYSITKGDAAFSRADKSIACWPDLGAGGGAGDCGCLSDATSRALVHLPAVPILQITINVMVLLLLYAF